jgi:hypothetical protein
MARSLDRRLFAVYLVMALGWMVATIATWVLVSVWWVGLLLSVGWWCLWQLSWLGGRKLLVSRGARRFNRRFPEDTPERRLAVKVLTGFDTPHTGSHLLATALAETSPAEAAGLAGLDGVSEAPGLEAAGTVVPKEQGPLRLTASGLASEAPAGKPAGQGPYDFIPLEVKGRPDGEAPPAAPSGQFGCLPIEPRAPPLDQH